MRILIILLLLTGCTAYKDGSSIRAWDPTTSVISQFLKAAVTGDTSKIKVSKKQEKQPKRSNIDLLQLWDPQNRILRKISDL